ncbi:serine/arginine repetitive matrix protein 5-like [Salvelinus sp. IW2-2015]|uniref:serine/arginine repetitive matrix protein 5-like n=1 Tax=Salvelinus sp. IW2-2015 TaxID=2691554 RepID=UPI000CEA8D63|nr:repetin-like [Salvelinus alpinus]
MYPMDPERHSQRREYGEPERCSQRREYGEPERCSQRREYGEPERYSQRREYEEPERCSQRMAYREPERCSQRMEYREPEGCSQRREYREPEGCSQRREYGVPERYSQRREYEEPERCSQRMEYREPERCSQRMEYREPEGCSQRREYGEPERYSRRREYGEPERYSQRREYREPSSGQWDDGLETRDNGQAMAREPYSEYSSMRRTREGWEEYGSSYQRKHIMDPSSRDWSEGSLRGSGAPFSPDTDVDVDGDPLELSVEDLEVIEEKRACKKAVLAMQKVKRGAKDMPKAQTAYTTTKGMSKQTKANNTTFNSNVADQSSRICLPLKRRVLDILSKDTPTKLKKQNKMRALELMISAPLENEEARPLRLKVKLNEPTTLSQQEIFEEKKKVSVRMSTVRADADPAEIVGLDLGLRSWVRTDRTNDRLYGKMDLKRSSK